MIDWNQPVDKFPEEIAFADLPPLARELIRKNAQLRTRLQEAEIALKNAQDQIKALEAQHPAATVSP